MREIVYIAPTERGSMSKARRTRIFLANNGRCLICGNQIRDGELWHIEHPEALNLGGSDNDADLGPVHDRCHAVKTSDDRKKIAKRNTMVDSGYSGKRKSKFQNGRDGRFKSKVGGGVVLRATGEPVTRVRT